MQSMTLSEVLAAFDPIDRADVTAPSLTGLIWDDLDFLGWRGANGKGFLVVPLAERTVGLVLRMSEGAHPGVCDLCLSIDRESGAGSILVQSWAKPRISYGIAICASLECSQAVRGYKAVYRMGETIPVGRRIERLQENVVRFARLISGLTCTGSHA